MPNTDPKDILITQSFAVSYTYPVVFTRNSLSPSNTALINSIVNRTDHPKILPVIDSSVLSARPELTQEIFDYFSAHQLSPLPAITIDGGESCKNNEAIIDEIYQAVLDLHIDRHSYIVVIGGGAVVDAVGYAAATAHRGIRLIRMPTTVLGQNDAAVGVKNAINFQQRKNFLGTFSPPVAVISDFDFLQTLTTRDKRAGIAEAIKVALIKDTAFFNELFNNRHLLAKFDPQAMESMIVKGAKWHLDHIANQGDPFEMGSARPLDFGHWAAHKLEELSANSLRHGEAVAIGIALDSIYSEKMGLLSPPHLAQIITLLRDLGFSLNHTALSKLDIASALNEFKEHLGGTLCITLLTNIGSGLEVNGIDTEQMNAALDDLKAL